jgi:hypothetical protein
MSEFPDAGAARTLNVGLMGRFQIGVAVGAQTSQNAAPYGIAITSAALFGIAFAKCSRRAERKGQRCSRFFETLKVGGS